MLSLVCSRMRQNAGVGVDEMHERVEIEFCVTKVMAERISWYDAQEQQQLIEEENRALVQQLMSLNQGATSIETTMRELATLNQMFSGQVCFGVPKFST